MNVTLINYTVDALNLLLSTKNTRLKFESDPATWTEEQKAEHLAYMKDTIKSSWEFVDYVFKIEGVTRAFTHQLVRTRAGSYAQESMRTVNVSGADVTMPQGMPGYAEALWKKAVGEAMATYACLLADGIPAQDVRGILPTNVNTTIIAKFNLRTLHDMAKLRLCTRTQGEYQDVFRRMRELVIAAHPWVGAFEFLEVHCVATGTCAFPRYGKTDCPIYDPRMDQEALKAATKEKFWSTRHEARPVAKEGKAS